MTETDKGLCWWHQNSDNHKYSSTCFKHPERASFRFISVELRTAELCRSWDTTQAEIFKFRKGQFVTAVYQQNLYIAQIKTTGESSHSELEFMRPQGITKCNWPRKSVVLLIPRCNVISVVDKLTSSPAHQDLLDCLTRQSNHHERIWNMEKNPWTNQ